MDQYPITSLIIGITSIVSFYAFQNESFYEKCIFSVNEIINSNGYYRIFTSILVHAGMGHLLFNMFSLYSFAGEIEQKYGYSAMAYIYTASGIGAGILSLLLHGKDKNYRALGASGAVCGIIFASIFLIPGGSVIVFPVPVAIPAWAYAVLFVLGSIYASNGMAGGIAHDAHLGGALTGIITAGTLDFRALTADYLFLGAVTVPIIIFFIFNRQISAILKK